MDIPVHPVTVDDAPASTGLLLPHDVIVRTVGFGSAIGVHFPIGDTSVVHLAPAYLGAAMFTVGIVLTYCGMTRGLPEPCS